MKKKLYNSIPIKKKTKILKQTLKLRSLTILKQQFSEKEIKALKYYKH